MEENKLIELRNKILEGLKISAELLLEEKKRINGKLVVFRDGEIKILDARSL